MPAYEDAWQRPRSPRPEALVSVLRSLGSSVADPSDAARALREREAAVWSRGLEPATVSWSGEPPAVELRVPAREADGPFEVGVTTEEGERLEGRTEVARPGRRSGPTARVRGRAGRSGSEETGAPVILGDAELEGVRYVHLRLPLPFDLPDGVHEVEVDGVDGTGVLIVAPPRAFTRDERGWGLFLPLHALRHAKDAGVGDYPALGRLLRWAGREGAEAFGTLPLLPMALEGEAYDPGPYAPISRLFWNPIYLDPTRVPGPGAPPDDPDAVLRDLPRVAWREVWARRRARLQDAWQAFEAGAGEAGGGAGDPGLGDFLERRPEVEAWARFRAVTDARGEPWPAWPAGLRSGRIPDGEAPDEGVRFHRWIQWACALQMEEARRDGEAAGLYLDLPLGTSGRGFDVWRHRGLFATGATGGAPPDAFHGGGQDWGFPPLDPHAMRADGYRHWRAVLDHHMGASRLLRVDHVMGLQRLFWVPDGFGPKEGVYVRYPAGELHALLCLASHRHRCEVVGEDLGTVPPEVREEMGRRDLRRMWILPFEFEEDDEGGKVLRRPPTNALAGLNTHDLPTFAGHWRGLDLEERATRFGHDEEAVRDARIERERERACLEETVAREGDGPGSAAGPAASAAPLRPDDPDASLDDGLPRDPALHGLLRRTLAWLGRSSARLVLVSLEDLWLETERQNRPGTPTEENWSGRARVRLEQIEEGAEPIESALEALRSGRSDAHDVEVER